MLKNNILILLAIHTKMLLVCLYCQISSVYFVFFVVFHLFLPPTLSFSQCVFFAVCLSIHLIFIYPLIGRLVGWPLCFPFLSFLLLPVWGVELADALPFLAERGGCVSAITFTSSCSASCTKHRDGDDQQHDAGLSEQMDREGEKWKWGLSTV